MAAWGYEFYLLVLKVSQSRTQSPRASWSAGERPERLWDNRPVLKPETPKRNHRNETAETTGTAETIETPERNQRNHRNSLTI